MSDKTVTLRLQGTVTVAALTEALKHFDALMRELSAEAHARDMRWDVTGLDASSAVITASADLSNGHTEDQAELVVQAYLGIGHELQEHRRLVGYRTRISRPALALVEAAGRDVEAVVFETPAGDAYVGAEEQPGEADSEGGIASPVATLGSVTGRVQSLSSRGGLRFTVYDVMDDRAVSCYLDKDAEELMRGVWGRLATVEGLVSRDPSSGRALAVRSISDVRMADECQADDYTRARGSVIPLPGADKPETILRKLRDAN